MAVPQSSPTRLGPPASGAYIAIPFCVLANATTSTSSVHKAKLPDGMSAVLVAVTARAATISSDPAISVGTTTATTGYVNAVNLTTAAAECSIAGSLAANGRAAMAAGSQIVVTVTNDAGDGHGFVDVVLYAYVTEHASNIPDV